MKRDEWGRKVKELQADHIAAGGFISPSEAERIIEEAYGSRPTREVEKHQEMEKDRQRRK